MVHSHAAQIIDFVREDFVDLFRSLFERPPKPRTFQKRNDIRLDDFGLVVAKRP